MPRRCGSPRLSPRPPPPGASGPPQAPVPPGGARPRGVRLSPNPTPPQGCPGGTLRGAPPVPLRPGRRRGKGARRGSGAAAPRPLLTSASRRLVGLSRGAAAGGGHARCGGGGAGGAGLRRELPPRVPRRSARRRRRRRRAAPAACQRLRVPAHPRSLPGTSRLPPPRTAGSPRPGPPCPLTPARSPLPCSRRRGRGDPGTAPPAPTAPGEPRLRGLSGPSPSSGRGAPRGARAGDPAGARPRWGIPRPGLGGCSARRPRLGWGAVPRVTEPLSLAPLSEIGAR